MAFKMKHVRDFEYASVACYIVWLEFNLGLKDFNHDHVNSCALGRVSPARIVKRKRKLIALMLGNMKKLEVFAGKYEGELEDGEMVVLRSMYRQLKTSIETCNDHIRTAKLVAAMGQLSMDQSEGEEDEPLF